MRPFGRIFYLYGFELLKEYGTIENIINANLSGKLGENIKKDQEIALKTKILATLYRDINFDFSLETSVTNLTQEEMDELSKLFKVISSSG